MPRLTILLIVTLTVCITCGADWLQFRGNDSTSVAPDQELPLSWSDKENIAWKVDLPGRGPSSPIVVGHRVFVTCSSGVRQDRLHVIAFDVESGESLWHRQFWATGRTFGHPTTANAAPSPASDGKYVFAFSSSNDLICLDLDGNLRWFRGLAHDYPKAGNDIGMSSSPIVVDDTVIVQIDNQGDPFAAGIDTETGETRWRAVREPIASWSSPTALRDPKSGKAVVVIQSPKGLTAHEPRTGKQEWRYNVDCEGITSSVSVAGKLYVPSNGIALLQASGSGEPKEFWQSSKLRPGAASPVVHDRRIYVVNRAGVLTCGNTEDGSVAWQLRLKGSIWSTPVYAGGHLYLINDAGLAQVVELGENEGRLVGTGDFGETIQGSPAIANNAMYVRSDGHLWKIAKK